MKLVRLGQSGFLAMLLLGLATEGCGGPTYVVQQYQGPVRPRETIAVIRINGGDPVQIVAVDREALGQPLYADARLHIEVLPGEHSLSIRHSNLPFAPREVVAFRAEPGRVYRAQWRGIAAEGQTDGYARVFEVDPRTDALLADVSLPSNAPPPVEPPSVNVSKQPAPEPEEAHDAPDPGSNSNAAEQWETGGDAPAEPGD